MYTAPNMKKVAVALSLFTFTVLSPLAHADEISGFLNESQELNLKLPKETIEPSQVSVTQRYDQNGVFYDVEMSFVFFPMDVTFGAGVSDSTGTIEVEAFAGIRAIRLLAGSGLNIPYGARVRVALNSERTLFAEYTYTGVGNFSSQGGVYETPHMISILKFERDAGFYYGCGIANSIHNPWYDETHLPEDGVTVQCRVGQRF